MKIPLPRGWRSLIFYTGCLIPIAIIALSPPRSHLSGINYNPDDYEVSKEPGYICTGYLEPLKSWDSPLDEACPAGYGIVASGDSNGDHAYGPPNYVTIHPHCCRLPFDDIFTDKHEGNIAEKCPDGSVMTSGSESCGANCTIRCTYINTAKYMLGPETQAKYVKDPRKNAYSGQGSAEKISLDDVPWGLRVVALRWGFSNFAPDGCIGYPFGSLMVRKSEKRCSGYFYRQLLFKDGTPVPMFPHCDLISDIYDPSAKCLVKKVRTTPE